ncbi:SDR family oxidoreductase [Polynucleobacter paneuropaeus]|nr:SDR family oxidoreductase [Polynucleobacter paneuropaeus]MBT8533709.1 SDR family oxidoreductase [Polynucleobacter paneuropaeus]
MSKVLIFGATGMLGSSLHSYLLHQDHEVFTAGRSLSSDILFSEPGAFLDLYKNLIKIKPEVLINLIAATNVDQCEQFSEMAYELNSEVPKSIARATQCYGRNSPHVIHISSDQVYSGPGPHIESRPKPCNVYGASKLAGEKWVLEIGGTVLRTNFVGASRKEGRDGFTDWLYKSNRLKTPISVLEDVLFSPGHINDVCEAIDLVIKNPQSGIYNYGSRSSISKSEFSFYFVNGLHMDSNLLKKSYLSDLSLLAKRPHDMSLNVSLYEKIFARECPEVVDVIKKCIKDYLDE